MTRYVPPGCCSREPDQRCDLERATPRRAWKVDEPAPIATTTMPPACACTPLSSELPLPRGEVQSYARQVDVSTYSPAGQRGRTDHKLRRMDRITTRAVYPADGIG